MEAVAVYTNEMQKLKELIKLSNYCNFQLFACNIEGNISHQKLRNCCVAKKLTSYTFSVKNFEFFEENFSETIRGIGLKFSEITETVMLFQYSEFSFY